jgi:formylglycine-generating enzyme required for sulfatase activity
MRSELGALYVTAKHTIRIFLASPGDTQPVRELVVKVVAEINANALTSRHLHIDLLRWDDPSKPVPCSFLRNPQRDVVTTTGDPAHCDLVIGLFKHHFGSPLPQADYGLSPDGDEWTGTEWELHRGVEGVREGIVKDVLVFRDTEDFSLSSALSDEEVQHRFKQYTCVQKFFADCKDSKTRAILKGINEHQGHANFHRTFTLKLQNWLDAELQRRDPQPLIPSARAAVALSNTELTPDQAELHAVLLTHDQPLNTDLVTSVFKAPVTDLRGYLLQRFAAWSRPDQGQLNTRFVNLDLLVHHSPDHDGETWEKKAQFDSLPAMLTANPSVGAWVLVGDPGGGKSTLLQQHEMQTARAALRALHQAIQNTGEPPELCIWQRLADFPHTAAEPQTWLNEQWAKLYPQLPSLIDLSTKFRLRYLLDGVNEIKAPNAAAYGQAVSRWADWAAALNRGGSQHAAPLFSVRTLEYSAPLTSATLQVVQARLNRWTPAQMQQYCMLALGPGNALWPQIEDDAKLLELCSLPFNLNAQCQLTRALGRPAHNRAELFNGLAWLRLRRAFERRELEAHGLLGELDRRQLTDAAHWKTYLNALPEEGSLVSGLSRQAEAMHRTGQGAEVSLLKKDVAVWFPVPAQHDAWLQAVQALNVAEVELSGRFRYTHQLWQEYFAARHLRNSSGQLTPEQWLDFKAPELEPLDALMARMAAKDSLPGPGVCAWEEAVKLAVQMSEAPEDWIAALQGVNLALAGRAARLCLSKLEATPEGQALLDDLKAVLLHRSRNAAVDVRLRIEAAEAMGWLGDPRFEERIAPDGKTKYLLPKAKCWVSVSGGSYQIGSDEGRDEEKPVTTVALGNFQVAFAPVTNAEYRHFIDAGGYKDSRWWHSAMAKDWREKGARNDLAINRWITELRALRQDFERAVQVHFPQESDYFVETELRKYANWTDAEANMFLTQNFGARPVTEPNFWFTSNFNNPTQPVVGVNVFEAQAYCAWLTAQSCQTGKIYRLPYEAEWEAAARGPSSHRWPWGNEAPQSDQINEANTRLMRPNPVGVFPKGDSTNGLADISGNVSEWTSSETQQRLSADVTNRPVTFERDGVLRSVRGGSWYSESARCRPGARDGDTPLGRHGNLGFRIVQAST